MPAGEPTLELERELFGSGIARVIGCDEVGRGALAGPVAVGMTVITAEIGPFPPGLRDSKLLSEPKRTALAPLCAAWVRHSAVGLAEAAEIDEIGIIRALGLAASRALALLVDAGAEVDGSVIILDGNHDYLTPALAGADGSPGRLRVTTRVKADQDCASVSAASVIAKVHRDGLMIGYADRYDGYGWTGNKGYGSAEHLGAIERLGPCELHRRTWLTRILAQPPSLLSDGPLGPLSSA